MSNTLGDKYRVQVFGQSHSPMIGAVIEGIPAGRWTARRRGRGGP